MLKEFDRIYHEGLLFKLKQNHNDGNLSCLIKIFLSERPEAVVQRCSVKKLFLEISQNSQENTQSLFLVKLQAWGLCAASEGFIWRP